MSKSKLLKIRSSFSNRAICSRTSRSGIANDRTLVVCLAQLEYADVVLDVGVLASGLAGDKETGRGQQFASLPAFIEGVIKPISMEDDRSSLLMSELYKNRKGYLRTKPRVRSRGPGPIFRRTQSSGRCGGFLVSTPWRFASLSWNFSMRVSSSR